MMATLFNRMVVTVFLLTGLMVGMAGSAVAQGRYAVGASYGVSSLTIAGIAHNGGTFMINGKYEIPLDEKGVSVSFEPGMFVTTHTAKLNTAQSGITSSAENAFALFGFRWPVLLKQRVDSWFFGGGAYVDLIVVSAQIIGVPYHTLNGAKESNFNGATNDFVGGLMGQVGYDFNWCQVMAGATLPLTNVYKNVSSAPLNIGVGVSTTF